MTRLHKTSGTCCCSCCQSFQSKPSFTSGGTRSFFALRMSVCGRSLEAPTPLPPVYPKPRGSIRWAVQVGGGLLVEQSQYVPQETSLAGSKIRQRSNDAGYGASASRVGASRPEAAGLCPDSLGPRPGRHPCPPDVRTPALPTSLFPRLPFLTLLVPPPSRSSGWATTHGYFSRASTMPRSAS